MPITPTNPNSPEITEEMLLQSKQHGMLLDIRKTFKDYIAFCVEHKMNPNVELLCDGAAEGKSLPRSKVTVSAGDNVERITFVNDVSK